MWLTMGSIGLLSPQGGMNTLASGAGVGVFGLPVLNGETFTTGGVVYTAQNGSDSYSLRYANGEARFKVGPGDKPGGDAVDVERSEVAAPRNRKGATIRSTFTLRVVTEGTADWVVLGQSHTGNDAGGRTPNWAFYLEGGALIFRWRYWNGSAWTDATEVPVTAYALGAELDIVVTHREHLTVGVMQVTVNGVSILNVVGTAGSPQKVGAYDEEDAPYFKFGVYRDADADSSTEAWYTDIAHVVVSLNDYAGYTNLFTSGDLNNAYWDPDFLVRATATGGIADSLGGTTAARLAETATSGAHGTQRDPLTRPAGNNYALILKCKAFGTTSGVRLQVFSSDYGQEVSARFLFAAGGSIDSPDANGSTVITNTTFEVTNEGNGWRTMTVFFTVPGAGSFFPYFSLRDSGGNLSYAGTITNGIDSESYRLINTDQVV
jgi:hypothetical protein